MKRNKKTLVRYIFVALLVMVTILTTIFTHFGGFNTGHFANTEEFLKYAKRINEIEIPETARINAETKINQYTDVLLQYCDLKLLQQADGSDAREKYMADNIEWIFRHEQQLGHARIFISGHNGHMAKYGSFDSTGRILADNAENHYYSIGTDFYKTKCNLPLGTSGRRTNKVFYSHNPLANAAKKCGFESCWLDFSSIPQNIDLKKQVNQYTYMGNIGEGYSIIMRFIPQSYRIFQPPAVLYDSMIFVTNATPTRIQ